MLEKSVTVDGLARDYEKGRMDYQIAERQSMAGKFLLIVCLSGLLLFPSCKAPADGNTSANQPASQPITKPAQPVAASAPATSEAKPICVSDFIAELAKFGVQPGERIMPNLDAEGIAAKVANDMENGRRDIIAEVVSSFPTEDRAVWHYIVAYEFSKHCGPEDVRNSTKVQKALKELVADSEMPSAARTLAAEALIDLAPDVAKKYLMSQYAALEPIDDPPPNYHNNNPIRQQKTGPALRKLGLAVPDEVVYLGDFRRILESDGSDVPGAPKGYENPKKVLQQSDLDDPGNSRDGGLNIHAGGTTDRLDDVGLAVNQKLRQLLNEHQFEKLKVLCNDTEYRQFAWQYYVQVVKSPRPPAQPGVFSAPDEDDSKSVFGPPEKKSATSKPK